VRALRWHGAGDVRLDEVAEPSANDFADSLIEVALAGICGTDVAETRAGPKLIRLTPHPLSGQEPPVTLGHELMGTLVEGGSPDGSIGPGARVTVDACMRCGACDGCRRGDYNLCRYSGSIGLHMDGGFAPLVAVPGYTLVAVPDEVSDRQAALTEPFAVAMHGLERAGVRAGDRILVMGFGAIGAASALVARALAAVPWVVEIDEERRATAEQLGIATLDPGEDLPKRVRMALGGGGADVVVESTGAAAVTPLAIECATRGGAIAVLGLASRPGQVDTTRLTLYERSLVGSLGYRHHLPRVLELVRAGDLDPSVVIGRTVELDEAATAISELAAVPGGPIKTMVRIATTKEEK
jgi:(R,R)-butanediol dehydrogenase/meso-butanediol dehydrogenase/diacetyl reductase